jgi:hypothetical protein
MVALIFRGSGFDRDTMWSEPVDLVMSLMTPSTSCKALMVVSSGKRSASCLAMFS